MLDREQQTGGTGLTGINLQYAYTAGSNSGQVSQMTDAIPGEQVTYTYDSLKRLIKAETTQSGGLQWGQSFGYDGFGNLTSKTPTSGHTGTSMSLSMDVTTNRVTSSGFAYDANGNTTSIPSMPQNINLTYDVENRTGGTWYDQQNQPLDRTGPGTVWNLYGLNGERLGTFTYSVSWTQYQNPNGNGYIYLATVTQTQASRNIYFGGRLIQSNGTTVVTDRTGSVRANESGQTFEYYPYGEEVTVQNPQDREKFATYTRESSTGLDYAVSRYYSSVYGRFTAADPYQAGASPSDTTTLGRYGMNNGDPINRIDSSGLYSCGLSFAWDGDDADVTCFGSPYGHAGPLGPILGEGEQFPICYATGFVGGQVLGCAFLIAAESNSAHPSAKLCPLFSVIADYTLDPKSPTPIHPIFSEGVAALLDGVFALLNAKGIVPILEDGFRTETEQADRQATYPGVAATGLSLHEIGNAIDFKRSDPNLAAIEAAMVAAGFVDGRSFTRKDIGHFQLPGVRTQATADACSRQHPNGNQSLSPHQC